MGTGGLVWEGDVTSYRLGRTGTGNLNSVTSGEPEDLFDEPVLVAVGDNGVAVYSTDDDPLTWRLGNVRFPDDLIELAVRPTWRSVAWNPYYTNGESLGRFVAVSDSYAFTGNKNYVMTSADGMNWDVSEVRTTSPAAQPPYGFTSVAARPPISGDPNLFVAVGYAPLIPDRARPTQLVWVSEDGVNWEPQGNIVTGAWTSVAWDPDVGRFVAVASPPQVFLL